MSKKTYFNTSSENNNYSEEDNNSLCGSDTFSNDDIFVLEETPEASGDNILESMSLENIEWTDNYNNDNHMSTNTTTMSDNIENMDTNNERPVRSNRDKGNSLI